MCVCVEEGSVCVCMRGGCDKCVSVCVWRGKCVSVCVEEFDGVCVCEWRNLMVCVCV